MADLAKRWTWIRDGDTLVDERDEVVLAIDDPKYITEANKRLIAKAPELLEALEDAQSTIHGEFCGSKCNKLCSRYESLLNDLKDCSRMSAR